MSDYERAARNLIEKGSPLDCFIREGADADRLIAEQQERIEALEAEIERLRKVGKQLLAIDMTLLEDLSPGAIEQFIRGL